MGLEGGGWESRSARPGREKRGGGGVREGREGGRGRRALRGTRTARGGGCRRRCALAPRVPGCLAETRAPPPPLRAAPRSHCCGRWRGARRRGAPGQWGGETMPSAKGGLAVSKASPDANSRPGLGRVECKGIAAWVGVEGVDGVEGDVRSGGGGTFCSCHRVNAGQLPGHPSPAPLPATSSNSLFQRTPSHSSLMPRPSSRAQRNLSLLP